MDYVIISLGTSSADESFVNLEQPLLTLAGRLMLWDVRELMARSPGSRREESWLLSFFRI